MLLLQLKLEECNEQLGLKHREMVKLQEREKVLITTFHDLLGENNKFEDFLTKVFKKKVKRVKKKEQTGNEGDKCVCVCECDSVTFCVSVCQIHSQCVFAEEETDSDGDSEDDDWDDDGDYDSGTEEGGVPLDDSVCPPGTKHVVCLIMIFLVWEIRKHFVVLHFNFSHPLYDPGCESELFENTLQLRERRLDLEELLAEEKKSAEFLKKECDALIKKVKIHLI